MGKEAFKAIQEAIESHPEYTYKGVGCRQLPCGVQVMIALNRLGTSGTGGAYASVARRYSISEGEVVVIMRRFMKAVLSILKNSIKRPEGQKRSQIIEAHKKRSGFTGCVGFVDGSLLSLHEKPVFEPQEAIHD